MNAVSPTIAIFVPNTFMLYEIKNYKVKLMTLIFFEFFIDISEITDSVTPQNVIVIEPTGINDVPNPTDVLTGERSPSVETNTSQPEVTLETLPRDSILTTNREIIHEGGKEIQMPSDNVSREEQSSVHTGDGSMSCSVSTLRCTGKGPSST